MQTIEITGEMIMKLCKMYDSLDKEESNAVSCATGIRHTLHILGIFIEGINNDMLEVQADVENN